MKRRLKINGFIISVVLFLIALSPRFFLRSTPDSSLDAIWEIFGVVLILLGQIFRISARGFKAEYSQQGAVLIQGGPYALVRNPMYLGILLIGFGIVAILFKWWVVCIFLSVFITRYIVLIFKEEKKLKALFPEDFADYQKRVPRLLPSWAALTKADISEYLPLKLSWLKKEISTILAVLLITLFIESWEEVSNNGIIVYLKTTASVFIIIILFIGLFIYLSKRTENRERNLPNKSEITL